MGKIIRRSVFVVLGVLVLALVGAFLVLDFVVERVIETKGSEIVGARVELGSADILFFPPGARLLGLQVADPDRPMRNALEIDAVALKLDAAPLFSRKVIVDDLAITRLRFDTPRTTSGALPGGRGADVTREASGTPKGVSSGISGFNIPDVRTLLEQEDLRSVKLAQDLKAEAEGRLKEWEDRLARLPNEKTLKDYEDRINSIGKTKGTVSGVLGAAGEFQSLQGEINTSLNLLKTASSELRTERSRFDSRLNELRRAPEEDFRKLKDKYGISVTGLGNLTRLFLEDNMRGYVDTALRWYSRFQPYLAPSGSPDRGGGDASKPPKEERNVPVPDQSGLPDFLIRLATISADLPWGQVNGRVENITDNQRVLGLPTVFNLGGTELKGLKAVALKGTYDELKAASASLAFELLAKGFSISDLPISQSKDLPILLKEGLGNLDIKGSILGDRINSTVLFDVQNALFRSGKTGETDDAARIISSALQEISHLGLSADITGTLSEYAVQLKSNLDGALRAAFETEAKRLAASFEKQLLAGIRERSSEYLGEATAVVSGLDGIEKLLGQRVGLASDLVGTMKKAGAGGLKLPF